MEKQNVRKIFIIVVNGVIMFAILIFLVLYSRFESRESYRK